MLRKLFPILFALLLLVAGARQAIAQGTLVSDWNNALLNSIRTENTAPPLAARNLAMVHTAMFDAVNSITRTHQSYAFQSAASVDASREMAAAAAGYQVAMTLFPSQSASFQSLYNTTLAAVPDSPAKTAGIALGQQSANAMLALRASDNSSLNVPYIPSTDPGRWQRTPPFFRPPDLPQWRYLTPFAMTSGDQFRPGGPPALTSSNYARDLNLTMTLGALTSTNRTAYQTESARFWSDFSNTVTPPGHWNQIAQSALTNFTFDLAEETRLFALLNLALADAGIVAWDAKYTYDLWRPITAIQNADLDGNLDTTADPTWQPLLNTPAHPEYLSGHSTFSGAAASLLAVFLGSDNVPFTIGSDGLPNVWRTYDSFSATAEEIGMSRIWGGIHFLSADLDGLNAGSQLGTYVFGNFLTPVPEPSTAAMIALGFGLILWLSKRGQSPLRKNG
jgi:membrane-associated phospholipid phosphatase